MSKLLGIAFILFTIAAGTFAFAPRNPPPLVATEVRVSHLLMLGAHAQGTRVVTVGERGNVFASDDSGASWRRVTSPTEATLTAVAAVAERQLVAVGHDAVILRSADAGETWGQVFAAPDDVTPLLATAFDESGHGFAVGAYGSAFESRDAGETWADVRFDEQELHLNAVMHDGAAWLVAGEAGTLLRSLDGGETWSRLTSPYEGSFFGALASPGGAWLVFGMRGHVLRSTDQGESWVEIATGVEQSLFGSRVLGDGTIVLVGQNGALLTSADDGVSFVEHALPQRLTRAAVTAGRENGELLLFGENGVTKASLVAGKGAAR